MKLIKSSILALAAFALLVAFCWPVQSQQFPPLRVSEADNSPDVFGVRQIKFPNGSVSNSSGVVTVSFAGAGFISGSGTTNTVAKFTASGAIGNSLLTDNGTNVTLGSGQFLVPNGSGANPSLSASSDPDTGIIFTGSNAFDLVTGTVGRVRVNAVGIQVRSDGLYSFNNGNVGATIDTALGRNAAGVLEANNGTLGTFRDFKLRQLFVDQTITAGGTTGAQTINKAAGTVNFAAGASSLVVTNNLVTASSLVFAVVRTNDATATIKNVAPTSGSFTITLTANATAETSVGFHVINQ
ncbi:MAG: hypothetical protein WBV94_09035 [Blastocatellia bacterium]